MSKELSQFLQSMGMLFIGIVLYIWIFDPELDTCKELRYYHPEIKLLACKKQ